MTLQDNTLSTSDLCSGAYFKESRHVILKVGHKNKQIPFDLDDIAPGNLCLPVSIKQVLSKISQLGLKELWLGQQPLTHNRWDHSVGTCTAGHFWVKVLREDERVPPHCLKSPLESWDKIEPVLCTAFVLHDYGHLPFAHLMDEVLQSINWIPQRARSYGLESLILQTRLASDDLGKTWASLLSEYVGIGSTRALDGASVRNIVQELIEGTYGAPWLQVLVNSPIDADKIDYMRYDAELLQKTDFPSQHRLALSKPTQWLTEFLQDQSVNHAGILCLHGRSARAAADLWRERMFAYDRLYLSPELRVADRMAFEIVQQFLIRSTMSDEFLRKIGGFSVSSFTERFFSKYGSSGCDPEQLISIKYEAVKDMMEALLGDIQKSTLEFTLLKVMVTKLADAPGIDSQYKNFIQACFACLDELNPSPPHPKKQLMELVNNSLVREPIVIRREEFNKARELIRGLQHVYNNEILIDIVKLPRVLSVPQRYAVSFEGDQDVEVNILVPGGPVETWGPGQRAVRPLSDEAVKSLEIPYSRICVIAPGCSRSARSAYIWDRVRAALLEANISLVERRRE
jgi:hypothetical protein